MQERWQANVQEWCRSYVETTSLAFKLDPPKVPSTWAESLSSLRIDVPGRPPELRIVKYSKKSSGGAPLRSAPKRLSLMHTFLHHELQAAELMAWAILAFPDTPIEFRRGLLGILHDELRHMRLYGDYLAAHGVKFGELSIRDWFWERVPLCKTPLEFVSLLGIGFEGGNLDHAIRFQDRFRDAGDEDAVRVQEIVGREEIAHVRFAIHWFSKWAGEFEFDRWREHLPPPLSPLVMRGNPICLEARKRAGFSDEFIAQLEAWNS